MKLYDYLVSYVFSKDGYLTPCSGTSQISRKTKIETFEDLNEVRDYLTKSIDGAQNISIHNFILLGRNKH